MKRLPTGSNNDTSHELQPTLNTKQNQDLQTISTCEQSISRSTIVLYDRKAYVDKDPEQTVSLADTSDGKNKHNLPQLCTIENKFAISWQNRNEVLSKIIKPITHENTIKDYFVYFVDSLMNADGDAYVVLTY
ncbi:MAG: hypothetical protein AB2693_19200 [Candidatus Thiodiazotropha sp.]